MKLQRFALGLVLVLWIPSTLQASELSRRQLNKSLRQADRAWAEGEVDKAGKLYQEVLSEMPSGSKKRSKVLYALSLLALAQDSEKRNPERARKMLRELANSFPSHDRRREILTLLGFLDGHADDSAQAREELTAAKRAWELDLEKRQVALQQAEAKVASLETELVETKQQLARKGQQKDNHCQEIEKELKKAKEDIRKLAQECAGCSDGP